MTERKLKTSATHQRNSIEFIVVYVCRDLPDIEDTLYQVHIFNFNFRYMDGWMESKKYGCMFGGWMNR